MDFKSNLPCFPRVLQEKSARPSTCDCSTFPAIYRVVFSQFVPFRGFREIPEQSPQKKRIAWLASKWAKKTLNHDRRDSNIFNIHSFHQADNAWTWQVHLGVSQNCLKQHNLTILVKVSSKRFCKKQQENICTFSVQVLQLSSTRITVNQYSPFHGCLKIGDHPKPLDINI